MTVINFRLHYTGSSTGAESALVGCPTSARPADSRIHIARSRIQLLIICMYAYMNNLIRFHFLHYVPSSEKYHQTKSSIQGEPDNLFIY